MAKLNGKPVSLEALIGLGDIFDTAVSQGLIELTPEEAELVNEGRLAAGRSTTHNILNGIGQDLGIVGEAGQSRGSNLIEAATGQNPDELGTGSAVQTAGGLGIIAAALIPGGRAIGAVKQLGRVGSIVNKLAKVKKTGTGLKNTAQFALDHKKAVAGGLVVTALGASVAGQALGGADDTTDPIIPEEEGDLPVEGDLSDLEAALAAADAGGEGLGFLGGIGEITITKLPPGPNGEEFGTYVVRLPDGSFETLFEEDLPASVAAAKKAAFDEAAALRKTAREEFIADRAFDQRNVDADRALSSQRVQNEAIANLPTLLDTLTSPRGQLLADALAGRARGDLEILGSQVSPQLRALFGLDATEPIPLEGAVRETKNLAQSEEFGGVGGFDIDLGSTFESAGRLDPRQIPTANFLSNLSAADSDVLTALMQIGGEDPRDIAAQQRRLAAPGSGRGVSASVSR